METTEKNEDGKEAALSPRVIGLRKGLNRKTQKSIQQRMGMSPKEQDWPHFMGKKDPTEKEYLGERGFQKNRAARVLRLGRGLFPTESLFRRENISEKGLKERTLVR